MNKNWLLAGLALVIGVAVSIYSKPQNSDATDVSEPPVYGLVLGDLEGEAQDFSQWRGTLLLVNFWASWCPPCRKEMPVFMSVRNKYRDKNFEVIGISIEAPAEAKKFRDTISVDYPLLNGDKTGMSLMSAMGNATGGLPFSVLFDRSGTMIYTKAGEFTQQELDDLIKKHL